MIYNSKTDAGHYQALNGAKFELYPWGKYQVPVFTLYYCEYDRMGQRTGIVKSKQFAITELEIKNGFVYNYDTFLYTDEQMALRAALD